MVQTGVVDRGVDVEEGVVVPAVVVDIVLTKPKKTEHKLTFCVIEHCTWKLVY